MLGKLEMIVGDKGSVSQKVGTKDKYEGVYEDKEVKENLGVGLDHNTALGCYKNIKLN